VLALDFSCIDYARRSLTADQTFYPETLKKLFLINAPWYFGAIFALVRAFIDADTAEKISIIGNDYMPQLLEYIDEESIPVELGGKCENVPWGGPWSDECGCSEEQILHYMSK
jgi:hypothetical protein